MFLQSFIINDQLGQNVIMIDTQGVCVFNSMLITKWEVYQNLQGN